MSKTKDIKTVVSTDSLTAGYDSTKIWQADNFNIKAGEFIGLLGPNGAGKTTLFRMLLGLQKPLSGSLKIFDETPKKGNPKIGYVPQRRYIDNDSNLDAIEYVKLAVNIESGIKNYFKRSAVQIEQATEALKLVNGLELAHKPLRQLSGGELQRVFLAQALVDKPELLLLDEPLANLDIRRETQMISLVKQVVKSQNIAAILIAHDINPLLPVVDRIIYIANGQVLNGDAKKIINSKTLSDLYNSPIEVLSDSKGRLAVLGIEEAIHHAE